MALALEGTPVHNNASSGTSLVTGAFTTSNASEVFIVATINSTTISSISGGGLTWAKRTSAIDGSGDALEEWAAKATGALSAVQFTITLAGATGFITVDTFAFSGQDTTTIWDGNASIPAHLNGPFAADPITVSTNNANDVVIGGFRMAGTASPTAGSGFTQISGANFQLTEYKIVSSAQTNLSVSITTGSGNSNGGVADALMAAAGAGFTAKNRRTIGYRVGSRSYY